MTRKFEFKNNNLKLDIAGVTFEVDATNVEFVKRVTQFGKDATSKAKELGEEEDYAQAVGKLIGFCVESIDAILGEGAANEIFKDREVGLFDALDVVNYIVSEVKTDRETKFKAYTPNRAERRVK